MHEPDDAELVRASLSGNRTSFETLVRRHQRAVYNVALRMVRDPEDARDLAQSAFVKAYEQLATFDPRFRFYSWIYRIAINEAINHLKRRGRDEPLADEHETGEPDPESLLSNAQTSRLVQDALMKLRPDHRTVLVLRHFLECGYSDIASIVGIPEKTVKSRLFSARRELKALLEARGVL